MSRNRFTKRQFSSLVIALAVLSSFVMVRFQVPQKKQARHPHPKPPIVKQSKTVEAPLVQKAPEIRIKRFFTVRRNRPNFVKRREVAKFTAIPKTIKKIARVTKPKTITIDDTLFDLPVDITTNDVTDFKSPLDTLIAEAFDEAPQGAVYESNRLTALINVEEGLTAEEPKYLAERVSGSDGIMQKNSFDDLKEDLAKHHVELQKLEPVPEPELVVVKKPVSTQKVLAKADVPTKIATREPETESVRTQPVLKQEEEKEIQPGLENEEEEEDPTLVQTAPNERATAVPSEKRVAIQNQVSHQLPNLQPQAASLGTTSVTTQVVKPVSESNPPPQPHPKSQRRTLTPEVSDPGMFVGRVTTDKAMKSWLHEYKGHVELALQALGSANAEDTRSIMFENDSEDFEFDGHGMQGSYRLVASIFSNAPTPVAIVPYPKPLTSGDYKQFIRFHIARADFDKAMTTDSVVHSRGQPLVMNLTIFKGASGNYRQAIPVPGAQVRLVGFDSMGSFSTDAEGNVRITGVSPHSEYIVEVKATGYYASRQIVPVFDRGAYSTIHLLAKSDVEGVTKYFTKKEQQEKKAVVMGRVFDSKTRAPEKNEEISLSFRKGRPVYFGALPDLNLTHTTETGLFGFYNVESSFRTIERASKKHAQIFNLESDHGLFIELGRGGSKNLKGRLFDPYLNSGVEGQVRLVGDEDSEAVISENGVFEIPEIDLPPGVLTLETRNAHYKTIWHTIPWSVREPEKTKNLFVLENEILEASQKLNYAKQDRAKGMVVGGAEAAFFQNGQKCVRVALEDSRGKQVATTSGPFPLAGALDPAKGFCLTQEAPGFVYFNIPSGEYLLKWLDKKGTPIRSHVIRVGVDRVSVVVN